MQQCAQVIVGHTDCLLLIRNDCSLSVMMCLPLTAPVFLIHTVINKRQNRDTVSMQQYDISPYLYKAYESRTLHHTEMFLGKLKC